MADTTHLVRRLLETADIERVVPRLPPDVLHRLIDHCGLEDCADLVALATPQQLERVLDADLWRAPVPGADEALDADRFSVWLEVLLQTGAQTAADKLAAMDLDLIVDGLAAHVRVFDGGTVLSYEMLDGVHVKGRTFRGATCEIGAFVVEARRSSAWEPIVELLSLLHGERPVFFYRLMRGCVALSNSAPEPDGFHALLDDRDQHRSDLSMTREARRDEQGYVAPAQGRAFLQAARAIKLDGEQPPADPVARACLRAIAREPLAAEESFPADGASTRPDAESSDAKAVAAVVEILSDAGVLARPKALIGGGDADATRLARVQAFAASHLPAPEELAFLANAVLAGCAVQGRPLATQEASDAVLATCNLGLENWPETWAVRSLVTAFQVGWAVLHRDVCLHGASALVDVLADVQCSDRDVHWALQTLRRELMRHAAEPWKARDALDAILMLDASAWAVLRSAIDECPTMHAMLGPARGARLTIDPAAFTFVACNADIAAVHQWLSSLTSTLTG